jgi:hypothetical protein
VGPRSRTWQGAGIFAGSTKIGVTDSETRGETNIEHGQAMAPSDQKICEVVLVGPTSGFGPAQEDQQGVPTKTTADARAIESEVRMRHTRLTLPRRRQQDSPRAPRAFLSAA